MSKAVRKRRSPEEAREEILGAARARLRDHGVGGLSVADVARDCGMSHATVIHHFGSTAGMRKALVAHMTNALLLDLINTLRRTEAPEPTLILRDLFTTLTQGGHADLLAWLAVSGDEFDADERDQHSNLFAELIPEITPHLAQQDEAERTARMLVFLVATSAIGFNVCESRLPPLLGLEPSQSADFPMWLGEQISRLFVQGD